MSWLGKFFGGAFLSLCLFAILFTLAIGILIELKCMSDISVFIKGILVTLVPILGGLGTYCLMSKDKKD